MGDVSMLSLAGRVSRDLDTEGVVHALTGSVAASIHGEPFTSIDIDFVVRMTPEAASSLAKRWARDLNADEESLRLAACNGGMANLLHFPSGLKIDISVLDDTPFHREVLRRRARFEVPGSPDSFWMVSAEDLVLMKLVWRKDTHSAKQWENAMGVARIQGHRLDWAYMRRWSKELGIESDLDRLVREAGI